MQPHQLCIKKNISCKDVFQLGKLAISLSTDFLLFFLMWLCSTEGNLSLYVTLEYVPPYCCSLFSYECTQRLYSHFLPYYHRGSSH